MKEVTVVLSYNINSWTDQDGKVRFYDDFRIDINGVLVRIKPVDGTSRDILKGALGVK